MKNLDGKTMDIVGDNIEKLKEIFPDIFSEGKIDFEALKTNLGGTVETEQERYSFNWNGKQKAKLIAQTPSTGTLRPCKEDSKNWDTTENLYIEGDNLEVLKLLQKSYHNKVKMIYIDPPYNTGKDFVYKDNFKDNIKNYMEQTGQVNIDGNKLTTNSDQSGRYHSNWLNMMYPRLKLARNLLKEDGVIFISIDDNEVSNLRKLCDEIFGEDNFVGTIGWESKTKSQNTKDSFNKLQPKIESIFVYGKKTKMRFNLISKGKKEYPESDKNGEYRYSLIEQMNSEDMRGRATMIFPIKGIEPANGKQWKIGQDTVLEFEKRNDIVIKNNKPYRKLRPNDERAEKTEPFWGFFQKELGTAETGKKELSNLIKGHGFDTVKPVEIIQRLIFHITKPDDIVLDFFSGSATTAHATMQLNAEDGGNRKYICVQLPEETNNDDFPTICEIGKERIRRAGEKIKEELTIDNVQLKMNEEKKEIPDIGFKVFKLDSSNIKEWDSEYAKDNITQSLFDHVDNIKPDRTEEDILFELLLKHGLDLTTSIDEIKTEEKKIFNIGNGTLYICLASGVNISIAERIIEEHKVLESPRVSVIFKDTGFINDIEKTNVIQTLKVAGITDMKSV